MTSYCAQRLIPVGFSYLFAVGERSRFTRVSHTLLCGSFVAITHPLACRPRTVATLNMQPTPSSPRGGTSSRREAPGSSRHDQREDVEMIDIGSSLPRQPSETPSQGQKRAAVSPPPSPPPLPKDMWKHLRKREKLERERKAAQAQAAQAQADLAQAAQAPIL